MPGKPRGRFWLRVPGCALPAFASVIAEDPTLSIIEDGPEYIRHGPESGFSAGGAGFVSFAEAWGLDKFCEAAGGGPGPGNCLDLGWAMRTYLYKLTSDRGGAPCAPPPGKRERALLTLSICKPAIRRTAQVGDRIVGITSRALELGEGYPLLAVIYAARVTGTMSSWEYYGEGSAFAHRPDCIYAFHEANGRLAHAGRSRLHDDPRYEGRDIGRYPYYKNARTVLSEDFRYFGAEAVRIPARFPRLLQVAESLGQGHRVFEEDAAEAAELEGLWRMLWKRETRFTAAVVEEEARGHVPR